VGGQKQLLCLYLRWWRRDER